MSDIQFFGNVDKTPAGKISSEMPAWFYDVHIEKLEEGIASKKRAVEMGNVPPEQIFRMKNEIKNETERIAEIKRTKPTLNGGQRTAVSNEYHKLQNQIADSMPTMREDQRGFVNPRDELARLKSPHIDISPKMAQACGVTPVKGKITGDQAAKCYKIMGKVLGENTNVERLRKEGKSESYRTMEDLTKKVLEKVAG